MSQIFTDPKAQVACARAIDAESRKLVARQKEIEQMLDDLSTGGVWRDELYLSYRRDFDEATRDIEEFARTARSIVQHLEHQAALGEKYLRAGRR